MALGCLLFSSGCSTLECDQGTLEKEGKCVVVSDFLQCGMGFTVEGNKCVPGEEWISSRCGENAEYDPKTNTCVGTGGGTAEVCPNKCGEATETRICVSGRVFHGPSLIKQWAGLGDAVPLEPSDNAVVKIYEPLDYVTDPTITQPMATVPVEANGCFSVESVAVPYTRLYAISVDDADESSNPQWAFAAIGHDPVPGENSIDLEIPAISDEVATAWGNDYLGKGTMFIVYRHFDSTIEGMAAWGQSVEGITPTADALDPPWPDDIDPETGEPKYPTGLYVMNLDPEDPTVDPTFFDDGAETTTTAAGIVALTEAPVKGYSGTKQDCTVDMGLGGSAPGTIFFRWYKVEGCAPPPGE
jgi:hypothetical protein